MLSEFQSSDTFRVAAALSGLGHDLFSNPGFELIHVGDDAH